MPPSLCGKTRQEDTQPGPAGAAPEQGIRRDSAKRSNYNICLVKLPSQQATVVFTSPGEKLKYNRIGGEVGVFSSEKTKNPSTLGFQV